MSYITDNSLYGSATDFWRHVSPPDTLFCDGSIEAGPWTDPVHTGSGLGFLVLDNASMPRDDFSVIVSCISSGELNVDAVLNVGPPPKFRISLNGQQSQILLPERPHSPNLAIGVNIINYQAGGFRLLLTNYTTPITIGAGDSSMIFTALRPGLSVVITQQVGVSQGLSGSFISGVLNIALGTDASSVPNSTPSTVKALLDGILGVSQAMSYVPGGTGAGIMVAAMSTLLPFGSFVSGDTWTFTTTVSPDIVAALASASRDIESYIQDTYQKPFKSWGADITYHTCALAWWRLLKKRGANQQQDAKIYDITETMQWLKLVSTGDIRPSIVELNAPRYFDQAIVVRRPFKTTWGL